MSEQHKHIKLLLTGHTFTRAGLECSLSDEKLCTSISILFRMRKAWNIRMFHIVNT